jgi:hypothetical protein
VPTTQAHIGTPVWVLFFGWEMSDFLKVPILGDFTVDIEEHGIAQLGARYTSPYRYAGVGFIFWMGNDRFPQGADFG